jgi:hypothetical protein
MKPLNLMICVALIVLGNFCNSYGQANKPYNFTPPNTKQVRQNSFGGYNYFDSKGQMVGRSMPTGKWGYRYYSGNGRYQGNSINNRYQSGWRK